MSDLRILSFGYGHGEQAPAADIVIDVRDWFRDPAKSDLRQLTDTCGAEDLVDDRVVEPDRRKRTVVVAIGCSGGRHRSVVIARELAKIAGQLGWRAEVEHLHVHLPVIERVGEGGDGRG